MDTEISQESYSPRQEVLDAVSAMFRILNVQETFEVSFVRNLEFEGSAICSDPEHEDQAILSLSLLGKIMLEVGFDVFSEHPEIYATNLNELEICEVPTDFIACLSLANELQKSILYIPKRGTHRVLTDPNYKVKRIYDKNDKPTWHIL